MSVLSAGLPALMQHVPSAKEKKYDRQLRLWAASGQAALEAAHILLINHGPGVAGVEALKNLILPGVGRFTIQDQNIVSEADLGVNFFLEETSIGKPRAQQTCEYLAELNPDVEGHAVSEPIDSWINSGDVLRPYTLILVASPVRSDVLSLLTEHAHRTGTPLFYMHSVGFYSHFSVILPKAFPIVDTHPEPTATTDLRLLKPWPELSDFAAQNTLGLKSLSGTDIGHVPYLLLLLRFLRDWSEQHAGRPPTTAKEKDDFKDFVKSAGPLDEENFAEAVSAINKNVKEPVPSASVTAVLEAPEAHSLTPASASFWFIASAIRSFYKQHGQLPLPGSLPDMKARSADYIALQNIYKTRAREDCAEVTKSVRQLEAQVGRTEQTPLTEIEQFCKLAAHIKLVRGSPTPLELALDGLRWTPEAGTSLVAMLPNPDFLLDSPTLVYIAFVAYDAFLNSHHDALTGEVRPPGLGDLHIGTDTEKLTGIAFNVLDAAINATNSRVENPQYDNVRAELANICQELVRAGGAELHNIASLTGGIVAQEIIKVTTRQYVPADNTVVFDGITSKSVVLKI